MKIGSTHAQMWRFARKIESNVPLLENMVFSAESIFRLDGTRIIGKYEMPKKKKPFALPVFSESQSVDGIVSR